MSKNSAQQRIECLKDWLHALESKRKRNQKVNRNKPQLQSQLKYHPALEYNGE
jgi:hypothetical protein